MKLKELSTFRDHLPRIGKSAHTIELQTADKKRVELSPVHPDPNKKVGGAALVGYADERKPAVPIEKKRTEDFGHLFPVQYLMENHDGAPVNLEEARELADKLDPSNPYHDFAIGELSLYHLAKGDVQYAYDSLEALGDNALAVHILSHIVMYEDEQKDKTLDYAAISQQLHELAIDSYDENDTSLAATALVEASEALENDKELRLYAKVAMLEHPEIPQAATIDSLYTDPDEHLRPLDEDEKPN
jgi:hypothetical protein